MRNAIRSGLTLLELSMAAAIFAVIASIAGQSLVSGTSMSSEISRSSTVTEDTNRVLQRIAGQLRSADYNWIYDNSNQPVPTYIFRVCTGLGLDPTSGEIGPRFDHTYTVAYDSINGTLSATLADVSTGRVIRQEIASDLRTPDGFRVGQLGMDELVKGNQLSLTVARHVRDLHGNLVLMPDGKPRAFEASTTIFLRSTIYANTNLTTTATQVGTGNAGSEEESDPSTVEEEKLVSKSPTLVLGEDTNPSTKTKVIDGTKHTVNEMIILGTLAPGSEATGDALDLSTFAFALSKTAPWAELTLSRGWVSSENKNKSLASNQFKLTGWCIGSLVITVSVENISGEITTVSKSF